jgi:hypothetical protein
MLGKLSARVIEVKTPHEMLRICDSKRGCQMAQIDRCLIDIHDH